MSDDLILIGMTIIALLAFNAAISCAILKALLCGNTLTVLSAQRRPGHRRSGVILRLPHINYGDKESLIDEA